MRYEDRSILTRRALAPHRSMLYGRHVDQIADVWTADRRLPLALVIHGGFWRPEYDRMHVRPMSNAIAQLGFTVASIDYRRTPGKPDDTVADVAAAVRFKRTVLSPSCTQARSSSSGIQQVGIWRW